MPELLSPERREQAQQWSLRSRWRWDDGAPTMLPMRCTGALRHGRTHSRASLQGIRRIAFAISAALDRTLELPPAWTAVLYGAAVMTGLSRMYDGRHWLSDVLAAAAIGYSFGQAVGSALHRELPPSGALQWEVLPGRASVRLALGR